MSLVTTESVSSSKSKQKKLSYFKKVLLTHSERTVCECVVKHRGTEYRSVENSKIYEVPENLLHANQECKLERISEMKSSKKVFSMKSETYDGLSNCSNFLIDQQKEN